MSTGYERMFLMGLVLGCIPKLLILAILGLVGVLEFRSFYKGMWNVDIDLVSTISDKTLN